MLSKKIEIKFNKITYILYFLLLISVSTKAHSQELPHMSIKDIDSTIKQKFPNIGIKDMSSTLKQKFPVCEKQLIVNWIHPEKYQGYSEYDTYNNNGRYIGKFKAFINLGGASLTYKLAAFLPKNKSYNNKHKGDIYYPYFGMSKEVNDNFDELYSLISKYGLFYYTSGWYSDDQSKTIGQITNNLNHLSLSNNTENICIIYPDESYAWLVETKKIIYTHTKEEIDKIYERIKKLYDQLSLKRNPESHRKLFDYVSVLDLNNDGIEDYKFTLSAIFSIKKRNGYIGYQDKLFPSCKKENFTHENSQLITNGKDFFWNNCNVSKLVK